MILRLFLNFCSAFISSSTPDLHTQPILIYIYNSGYINHYVSPNMLHYRTINVNIIAISTSSKLRLSIFSIRILYEIPPVAVHLPPDETFLIHLLYEGYPSRLRFNNEVRSLISCTPHSLLLNRKKPTGLKKIVLQLSNTDETQINPRRSLLRLVKR
jgi:hypothetical protein